MQIISRDQTETFKLNYHAGMSFNNTDAGRLLETTPENIDTLGTWLGVHGVSKIGTGEHDQDAYDFENFMFVTEGLLFY